MEFKDGYVGIDTFRYECQLELAYVQYVNQAKQQNLLFVTKFKFKKHVGPGDVVITNDKLFMTSIK